MTKHKKRPDASDAAPVVSPRIELPDDEEDETIYYAPGKPVEGPDGEPLTARERK